ncbi:MAG: cupin domain-containing protein [Bacteroidetes bacterium]|nr:cupin domain-containing protein [Bacteroidota bacterium]
MNNFLGAKLKTILEERKMSINEFAEKSDMSIEQLTDIINDKVVPSLTVTSHICDVLGIREGTLLDGTESTPVSIVRNNEQIDCKNSYTTSNRIHTKNLSYKGLTTKTNRSMDPYLIVVSDEPITMKALVSHEGEEFIYVLEGEIEFYYGDKMEVLKTGDTVYFDSIIPHCMKALTKGGSKVLSAHYRL